MRPFLRLAYVFSKIFFDFSPLICGKAGEFLADRLVKCLVCGKHPYFFDFSLFFDEMLWKNSVERRIFSK